MDNFLNILRLDVDGSDRVYDTTNLSLNQCSNNNRLVVYYEPSAGYSYIEVSFRDPHGSLTKRFPLIFDVDDEGYKYAYYDIAQAITAFKMGGRNAILTANLYFGRDANGQGYTSTAGNIRINVNYVDDADVDNNITPEEVQSIYTLISAVQNDFNQFKTGDIQVGKAEMDAHNNVIHLHYETKGDARDKFDTLDEKKLDKTEIADQTQRLNILETGLSTSNTKVDSIESSLNSNNELTVQNRNEIEILKTTKISEEEFDKVIQDIRDVELNLQTQIDGLHQGSNFRDMVDFASKLTPAFGISQGYNEGDRILALNTNTVYKWNGSSFENVGVYGASSYSKAEIDSQHNTIKDTIPNKATLSNGELKLSKGNTPISTEQVKTKTVNGESIWGDGNIVIPVDSSFSTTSTNPVQNKVLTAVLTEKADKYEISDLRQTVNNKAEISQLENKQDKLIAGANIKIENNIISASSAITLKKVEELPAVGLTNIIYLYKPVNETSYSEYLWDDDEKRWEPFGEAGLDLDKYYTSEETDAELELKVNKTDYEKDLTSLDSRISRNTAAIDTKADRETTSKSINELNASVISINNTLNTKANNSDILNIQTEYARKDSVPAAYQEFLKSGQNIKYLKTANGTFDLLGSGELAITDISVVDLGLYYTKDEIDPKFALKTELFDKDYGKLNNKPDLGVYRLISDSYSKEEVNAAIEAADISDKLNDYYTIEQVDAKIAEADISDKLTEYATKTEVADAVAAVDVSEQLKSYPTKTEVAQSYPTKKELVDSYATIRSLENVAASIKTDTAALSNGAGFITLNDIPKDLGDFTNNKKGYLTTESTAFKNKQDKLVSGNNIKTINGSSILGEGDIKIVTDISHLETKTDASTKLNQAKAYTDTAKSTLQTSISANTTSISSLNTALDTEKENRIGAVARLEALITANDGDINTLQTNISNEITNRTAADAVLETKITTEADERKAADTALDTKITTEIADRKTADTQVLADAKAYVDNALGGDDGILEAIEAIREQLGEGAVDIMASINQNKSDIISLSEDLEDEVTNRTTAISGLQGQITKEIADRTAADTTLEGKITTEISDRTSADNALDSKISTNKTNISNLTAALETEVSERKAADNTLTDKVNTNTTNISTLTINLSAEIKNREDGDTALGDRIDEVEEDLSNHIDSTATTIANLRKDLDAEIARSTTEDGGFGDAIDNLKANTETAIKQLDDSINEPQIGLKDRLAETQKNIGDHITKSDTNFSTLDQRIGNKVIFKIWKS